MGFFMHLRKKKTKKRSVAETGFLRAGSENENARAGEKPSARTCAPPCFSL